MSSPADNGTADLETALARTATLLENDAVAAERQAREILKAVPDEVNASRLLARALRVQGRTTEAREILDRLLEQLPDSALAHQELGLTLRVLGTADRRKRPSTRPSNLKSGCPRPGRHSVSCMPWRGRSKPASTRIAVIWPSRFRTRNWSRRPIISTGEKSPKRKTSAGNS